MENFFVGAAQESVGVVVGLLILFILDELRLRYKQWRYEKKYKER